MKNLKKVVALSLAAVMMFGMMVVGAGAATYTDAADIVNGVAVSVMSDINVLKGHDGVYNPDGILNRAEAATIAARLKLKAGADTLESTPTNTIFSDVPASHWASGIIAWANGEGIIEGYNGKFDPSGELTGYAFAKILLCTIGYRADIEDYSSDMWAINVNYDALLSGLLTGLETLDLSKPLSRDTAAKMAFNAITECNEYYYYTVDVPADNLIGYAKEIRGAEYASKLADDYGLEYIEPAVNADNVVPGYWQYEGNLSGYTGRIEGSEVAVAPAIVLTGNYNTDAGKVALAKNQLKDLTDNCTEITSDANLVDEIAALTGNGITVSLWVNAAGGVSDVAISYEALSTVNSVKTDRDGNVTRISLSIGGNFDAATETTEATEGFDTLLALDLEEDDVVLVKMVDGGKADVIGAPSYDSVIGVPEKVEGTVAKKDAAGFVMADEDKFYATKAVGADLAVKLGKTNYAYLDTNGFVLAVSEVPNVTAPQVPNYLLITEIWMVNDNSTKGEDTLHFSGITMDGTVIEDGVYVPGAKDIDSTSAKDYRSQLSWATVNSTTGAVTSLTTTDVDGDLDTDVYTETELKILVTYSYNDKTGVYTFADQNWTDKDADGNTVAYYAKADAIANTAPVAIELTGNETILTTAGNKFFASNVEFVFAYDEDGYVAPTSKTGVLKTSTGDTGFVFTTKDAENNDIITRVFVLADPTEAPVLPDFVDGIYYIGNVSTDFNYYTVVEDGDELITLGNVTAYVDGEKTDLDFIVKAVTGGYTLDVDGNNAADTITAGFYKVEFKEYGNAVVSDIVTATKNELTEATMAESGTISIDGGVKLVNGKYYVNVGGTYYDATDAMVLDLDNDAVHGSVRDLYVSANHTDTSALDVVVLRNVSNSITTDTSIVAIIVTNFVG